jgi:hypothetical protein
LIILAFSISIDQIKKRALDSKLKSLAIAIDQASVKSKSGISNVESNKLIEECIEPSTRVTSTKKININKGHIQPISKIALAKDVLKFDSLVNTLPEIEHPETSSIAEIEAEQVPIKRVVHAIFSAESTPSFTSTSKQGKKIRLRLFRQEEETALGILNHEPLNLSARINKK